MGAIVNILVGSEGQRRLEGVAEITEVIEYGGDGWYIVECVFRDDPEKKRCRREWCIDEEGSLIQPLALVKATPPLPDDVLDRIILGDRTQKEG
jgi:hypothetical protein